MKPKTNKIAKNEAFTRNLKIIRPKTRASIKQEIEDSKESMRRALYSPVKVEPPSLEISKSANRNLAGAFPNLYLSEKERHCYKCNIRFTRRALYLEHESHSHSTNETPIFSYKTLCCNICGKTYKTRKGYRNHMRIQNNVYPPSHTRETSLISDPLKEPDVNDPNNYCLPCDFTFSQRVSYRHHLLTRHNIPRVATSKELKNAKEVPPTIDILNLYCDICIKIYDTKSVYFGHLVRIHGMVLPDIYSEQSNFDFKKSYCKVCDKKYKSRESFRSHLQKIHHTDLPSRPDVMPDANNKNHYCVTCDKKFSCRSHFLCHLTFAHVDENLDIFKGEDCSNPSSSVMNGNKYCSNCCKVFLTRKMFEIHLERIHGTKYEPSKSLPGTNDPDVNDPNNHCSSCKKTYAQKHSYHRHLIDFHNLIIPPVPKREDIISDTIPVVDLLKRYCNVCDRRYVYMSTYRNHLSKCHGIEPHQRRIQRRTVNRNVTPGISNIANHCTACDKIFCTRQGYRTHCRRIHGMVPPRLHPINHDITPDIDDKNHYCAACNRTYASRRSLRSHLSHVHKMKVSEIRQKKRMCLNQSTF